MKHKVWGVKIILPFWLRWAKKYIKLDAKSYEPLKGLKGQ